MGPARPHHCVPFSYIKIFCKRQLQRGDPLGHSPAGVFLSQSLRLVNRNIIQTHCKFECKVVRQVKLHIQYMHAILCLSSSYTVHSLIFSCLVGQAGNTVVICLNGNFGTKLSCELFNRKVSMRVLLDQFKRRPFFLCGFQQKSNSKYILCTFTLYLQISAYPGRVSLTCCGAIEGLLYHGIFSTFVMLYT